MLVTKQRNQTAILIIGAVIIGLMVLVFFIVQQFIGAATLAPSSTPTTALTTTINDEALQRQDFDARAADPVETIEQERYQAYAPTTPLLPQQVAVLDVKIGGVVDLFWQRHPAAAPVTAYRIYRSSITGQRGEVIADRLPLTTTHFRDTQVVHGQSYWYSVAAVVTTGGIESVAFAPAIMVIPTDQTPPAAPTAIMIQPGADGTSAEISWTSPADADLALITIYRSTSLGALGDVLATVRNGTIYTDQPVVPGTTYYYLLTATDTSGNESTTTLAFPSPGKTNPFAPFAF